MPCLPYPLDDCSSLLEQNLVSLWSHFGTGERCYLHADETTVWFSTPLPTLPYNAVIRFCADENAEQRIADIFSYYESRSLPFLWIVSPSSRPADLGNRLWQRGHVLAESCTGMRAELDSLPPPPDLPGNVRIYEVSTEDERIDLLGLIAWRWAVERTAFAALSRVVRAFGIGQPKSATRCWIASKDGVPVAKALTYCAHGIAGLYGVATRPEARGLGLATSLTLHALAQARIDGYRVAGLHATPAARTLYRNLGFVEMDTYDIFAPPHSVHL